MKIIKEAIANNDKGLDSIELVKGDKHIKMSLTGLGDLSVCFFYDDDKKGYWFQESFDIGKEDEEVYKAVDGIFLSYSGDVFFDTYKSNMILLNDEGTYRFLFMKEFSEASKDITCDFFDDSLENRSMKNLFLRLQNLEQTKEENIDKPKTLSKTLNKIVEK